MSEDTKKIYEERLGRYQAAIALEPVDRIPIAVGSNYFAEVYSGNTNQETIYDPEKWLKAEEEFVRAFPEIDVLRNNRIYAPMLDAVGCRTYKLPGRDLPPRSQFQFVEDEYMKPDEYDVIINDPMEFMMDRWLPRVLGELSQENTARAKMALIKGGMAQVMMGEVMKNRALHLQNKFGMPQPMQGFFLAPFDVLADTLRGLRGILLDLYRHADKVQEACDVLVDEMVNLALATADPLKRYPIFVPTHKACFLSPKQFEQFYWPSFKKTMEKLIDAGYTIRAYLEGNWGAHWKHFLELPKGKVLCDIDTQGDIFKAKKEIGHHQCLAGGIPDTMFILNTPEEMREHVKMLCETVAKDGGIIINGGCQIPYDTKPENYRAMIDAVIEYGTYDTSIKPTPKDNSQSGIKVIEPKMLTPWEVKKEELGGVQGDEDLIRSSWEMFEKMGYAWVWQWVL